MNLDDPRTFELFLEVYGTLPRAGPGSTADTLRALSLIPTLTIRQVLDLGCGPGAQTLVLAEALPEAEILAVDLVPRMVTEARRRCEDADLSDRVRVEVGDMLAPEVPSHSQDLIWCEGAIYCAGIENALRTWRPLLTSNGAVAFTEAIWLHSSPPESLLRWWRAQYPAITDEEGVRTAVTAAGFDTVGFFILPASSWWTDYYEPMTGRIIEFTAAHPEDPVAAEIAASAETEIAMFREYSQHYSYCFFIVQPRSA